MKYFPLVLILVFGSACTPELDDSSYLIDAPRTLAVIADPAESAPNELVRYFALVAEPRDSVLNFPLTWWFCDDPKPLTEDNVVSAACLATENLLPAQGYSIEAVTPADACSLFGPDLPPGDFRPRAPDITGGYYLPLIVRGAGEAVTGQRLACNLARATPELARAFRERYRRNENPSLEVIGLPVAALRNSAVTLRVQFSENSRETYTYLDPETNTLQETCEDLTVSWYTTAGSFLSRRTGTIGCAESSNISENILVTPNENTFVSVWAVLRDSRGGVAVTRLNLPIQ